MLRYRAWWLTRLWQNVLLKHSATRRRKGAGGSTAELPTTSVPALSSGKRPARAWARARGGVASYRRHAAPSKPRRLAQHPAASLAVAREARYLARRRARSPPPRSPSRVKPAASLAVAREARGLTRRRA